MRRIGKYPVAERDSGRAAPDGFDAAERLEEILPPAADTHVVDAALEILDRGSRGIFTVPAADAQRTIVGKIVMAEGHRVDRRSGRPVPETDHTGGVIIPDRDKSPLIYRQGKTRCRRLRLIIAVTNEKFELFGLGNPHRIIGRFGRIGLGPLVEDEMDIIDERGMDPGRNGDVFIVKIEFRLVFDPEKVECARALQPQAGQPIRRAHHRGVGCGSLQNAAVIDRVPRGRVGAVHFELPAPSHGLTLERRNRNQEQQYD